MAETEIPHGLLMPVEFGLPFTEDVPSETGLETSTVPRSATTVSISYLTDRERLASILPRGKNLSLRGDPILTVSGNYNAGDLRAWAGRTYDIVMMTFPVTFEGKERQVHGDYAPLVLENLADPIIAGRELLGWSKVFADIEQPRIVADSVHGVAGWGGFNFLDLRISNLTRLTDEELKARQNKVDEPRSEGSIHYKYIRRTGSATETDADYLTMSTNVDAPNTQLKAFSVWSGEGDVAFHRGGWRDLPMMIRSAVNTFADLPVLEVTSATLSRVEMISSGGMGRTFILE